MFQGWEAKGCQQKYYIVLSKKRVTKTTEKWVYNVKEDMETMKVHFPKAMTCVQDKSRVETS